MESPPLVITSPAPSSPSTSPAISMAPASVVSVATAAAAAVAPSTTTTVNPVGTFPPSPPSSCGDRSPPPKEPKIVVPPSIVVPIPKVALRKPILPFSIENILRPGFGSKVPSSPPPPQRSSAFIPHVTDSVLRTPPKTPELSRNDSPVDLSHKKSLLPAPQPLKISAILNLQQPSSPSTSGSVSPKSTAETKTISTNTSEVSSNGNSRVRYPDNPEELANPPVPSDDMIWPAWVYCTRYSDRPSSGPRSRRIKRRDRNPEEKRPRTAFTSEQLARLKNEFDNNRYLDDKRRQNLARELNLNESQIKIWFQNKRAKDKKVCGPKNGLAQHLIAQGLYNHSTMPVDEDDPYLNGTL